MSDTFTERFLQAKEQGEALSRWLAQQTGWTVAEVAEHFQLSRKTVEGWPFEVLPYTDVTPTSKRETRRYRQEDVLAAGPVLRAWKKARSAGEEGEFIEKRRLALENRDRQLIELALGQHHG